MKSNIIKLSALSLFIAVNFIPVSPSFTGSLKKIHQNIIKSDKEVSVKAEIHAEDESSEPAEVPEVGETNKAQVSDEAIEEEKYGVPVSLYIPRLKISALIVVSGKDEKENMYVPPDPYSVGWWKYGKLPGEEGTAVLAGHYKVDNGDPGIFNDLNNVVVGDEIQITAEDGKILNFEVYERQIYSVDDFPLKHFFSAEGGRFLNIITCSGKYDPSTETYTHRLAVYAELIN